MIATTLQLYERIKLFENHFEDGKCFVIDYRLYCERCLKLGAATVQYKSTRWQSGVAITFGVFCPEHIDGHLMNPEPVPAKCAP